MTVLGWKLYGFVHIANLSFAALTRNGFLSPLNQTLSPLCSIILYKLLILFGFSEKLRVVVNVADDNEVLRKI